MINYKGSRVICQSIIPGILNSGDLSQLAEYGQVDEKKTITANETFHKLMLMFASTFILRQIRSQMRVETQLRLQGPSK